MALEAINEIREAEKKAETIVLDAKQKAKEIIANAAKEADIKYDEIINDAKTKANYLLNAALEEGNSNAQPILEMGEKDIDVIRNIYICMSKQLGKNLDIHAFVIAVCRKGVSE